MHRKNVGIKGMLTVFVIFLCAGTTIGCNNNSAKDASAAKATASAKLGQEEAGKDSSKDSSMDSNSGELSSDDIQEYVSMFDNQQTQTNSPASLPEEYQGANVIVHGTAYYNCEFEADRDYVAAHGIDIKVGDNLYTTQINDWYMNYNNYEGKTVEIEGYYLDFSPYVFVGRNGPTCPYCTGGYVDFEMMTDQDLSQLQHSHSWIKVQGILKKGFDTSIGEFYYLEATTVEEMAKVGKDIVTN